jgi:hypothetical protein
VIQHESASNDPNYDSTSNDPNYDGAPQEEEGQREGGEGVQEGGQREGGEGGQGGVIFSHSHVHSSSAFGMHLRRYSQQARVVVVLHEEEEVVLHEEEEAVLHEGVRSGSMASERSESSEHVDESSENVDERGIDNTNEMGHLEEVGIMGDTTGETNSTAASESGTLQRHDRLRGNAGIEHRVEADEL